MESNLSSLDNRMKVTAVWNNFQGYENFLIGGQRVCLSICLKHVLLFDYTFELQNGLLEKNDNI